MLKTRPFHDGLIFNMGIAVPEKMAFILKRGPHLIKSHGTLRVNNSVNNPVQEVSSCNIVVTGSLPI